MARARKATSEPETDGAPAPKKAPARRRKAAAPEPIPAEIPHAAIELLAYELHLTDAGADPLANWLRAEAELRMAQAA